MAVTELIAEIRPVFRDAFEKVMLGDDLTFDVTFIAVPDGRGGAQIHYMCYVHCLALHILGEYLQAMFSVPIGASPDFIERAVHDQVMQLRARRSQLLAQATNGGATGPGPAPGLLMP